MFRVKACSAVMQWKVCEYSIKPRAQSLGISFASINQNRVMRRFCSVSTSAELQRYFELRDSSEIEKIQRLVTKYFPGQVDSISLSPTTTFTKNDLQTLIKKIEQVSRAPLERIAEQEEKKSDFFIHFESNRTFINLPYSTKTAGWTDRAALQELIRTKFRSLFQQEDLVVVPGCADGQIPMEIYGNSLQNDMRVKIIAADLNSTAMQLGYHTMNSFGLEAQKITWVQADVTKQRFFEWINNRHPQLPRHQVITLIQPCLRETQFLALLNKSTAISRKAVTVTTVVMPVLLEEHESRWYQDCDRYVKYALEESKRKNVMPELIWQRTKYGHEMLRFNAAKNVYMPEQYFVQPSALSAILRKSRLNDVSQRIFPGIKDPTNYADAQDPRRIEIDKSCRIFCIWETPHSE